MTRSIQNLQSLRKAIEQIKAYSTMHLDQELTNTRRPGIAWTSAHVYPLVSSDK